MALGQYLSYHEALRRAEPDRTLYLAIPEDAWQTFFAQDIVRRIIEQHDVRIVVFNVESEKVTQWTS